MMADCCWELDILLIICALPLRDVTRARSRQNVYVAGSFTLDLRFEQPYVL
jgi:hypothetical protein